MPNLALRNLWTRLGKPKTRSWADDAALIEQLGDAELARDFRQLDSTLSAKELRLAVFGEFSAGKSTLINALLGRRVLPAKLRPTTGHETRLIGGPTDEVTVRFWDGHIERCPLDGIERFGVLDIQSRAHEGIERLEASVRSPILQRGLIIVDTPGVNDAEAQTLRAKRAVAHSDLVLLVLNANQLLRQDERKLTINWITKELGKPVVPVLNFLNQVEEQERPQVRDILKRWVDQHLTPVWDRPFFEVNALNALRFALGLPSGSRPSDDFFALQTAIQALPDGSKANQAIKERSRRNTAKMFLGVAQSRNNKELDRLRHDRDQLVSEREAMTVKLREAESRIERGRSREETHFATIMDQESRSGFETLRKRLEGSTSADLQERAYEWFEAAWGLTIQTVEATGDRTIADLRPDAAALPPSLTIGEFLQLDERAQVRAEMEFNQVATIGGGAAGAALGMMVGGPIGAFFGYVLGAVAASGATSKPPDYVAAYSKALGEDWVKLSERARALASAQFAARLDELLASIRARLQDLARLPPIDRELESREQWNARLQSRLEEIRNLGPDSKSGPTA